MEGPGPWYVAVHGYSASSVELAVTYSASTPDAPSETTEPPESPADPLDSDVDEAAGEGSPPVVHLDITGAVAQDELLVYSLSVTAGERVVVRTAAEADVDLYVRLHQAPTTQSYDARGYTYSGNEEVSFVPESDGVLFVGVHGWEASSFRLTTGAE